tara:strand:+ start:114 stop:239 length:126 start_codon:yes stop_codon:yes gene_type:complete
MCFIDTLENKRDEIKKLKRKVKNKEVKIGARVRSIYKYPYE